MERSICRQSCLCVCVWVLVTLLYTVSAEKTNLITNKFTCCGFMIMDTSNRVVIDESRPLRPGVYTEMRALFCTLDPILIQMWRKTGNEQDTLYTLVKSQKVDPGLPQYRLGRNNTVPFTTPWEIEDDGFEYMLGIFSSTLPMGTQKISIPYEFSETYSLFNSKRKYDEEDMIPGKSITQETLKYPRSVHPHLQFCASPGCQISADDPDVIDGGAGNKPSNGGSTSGSEDGSQAGECCNQPGPAGPPGPPGAAGPPGSFDPIEGISCDIPDSINDDLNSQSNKLNDVGQKTTDIYELLLSLTSSQFVTGLCPPGFLSSSYGVGSCYIVYKERVQMANAVLKCRDDHAATLVSIETELEEKFIKQLVSNITALSGGISLEEYWTAGMYNMKGFIWVWYDETTRTKSAMNYRNWQTGREPLPETDDDVCMAFTMDYQNNEDYWKHKNCNTMAYFICEIPKRCL